MAEKEIKQEAGDASDQFGTLEGDVHLTKNYYQGEQQAPRIPLQRPPRAQHFTDREEELAQLLADLQAGQPVTLCGPGGMGKTALAAKAI